LARSRPRPDPRGGTNQRSITGAETALTFKALSDAAVVRNNVLEQLERAHAETDPEARIRVGSRKPCKLPEPDHPPHSV